MDGEHLGDPGCLGEDVPEPAGAQGGGRHPGGGRSCVCAEPHVLIRIHTEYERQAETQLVTSELAPCYLWEHAAICQLLRHPTAPSLCPAK